MDLLSSLVLQGVQTTLTVSMRLSDEVCISYFYVAMATTQDRE